MKFFIDGHAQYHEEILELLPVSKDKSLLGYHRRMHELFEDYCLVCDELVQVAGLQWSLLGDFAMGLYRHVGFPVKFAEIGLYLGNYRTTPFGVHVDGCGVLSFPVEGEKHFRVWSPQIVAKNPRLKRSHEFRSFQKHSQLLVAKPGDMAYWPSAYWHIAESNGLFNATWSLGIWLDQPLSGLVPKRRHLILPKRLWNARTIQLHDIHEQLKPYFRDRIARFGFRNSPLGLSATER